MEDIQSNKSYSFQFENILKLMDLSNRSTSSFDSTQYFQQNNCFEMVLSNIHTQLVQLNKKLNTEIISFDFKLLNSLMSSLQSVNKHFLNDMEKIGLTLCEEIFETIILLFIRLVKENPILTSIDIEYLETILSILQEIIKLFPYKFYLKMTQQEIITNFNEALSNFGTWRTIIYTLNIQFKDEALTQFLKANIKNYLNKIYSKITEENFIDVIKEMSTIAELFKNDFNIISDDYYQLINQILFFNQSKLIESVLKTYFLHLAKLLIQDTPVIYYPICDIMLKLYEINITSIVITQAIIISIFTTINGDIYIKLLKNTLLIEKFISQLHKQSNQETIAYFFYFLNSLCLSYEISPNVNYTPKIELQAIIVSLQYYTGNEEILRFILERIKSLFEQNKYLGNYFLENCCYFENIHSLIATKVNISNTLLDFTEFLLKTYLTHTIWDKVTKTELLNYDINELFDPITLKKIKLTFIYELNPSKYYEKSKLITQTLRELIQINNIHKFICLLDIFLQTLSQTNIEILFVFNEEVYKTLIILIKDFIFLSLSQESDIRVHIHIIPLLNEIFSCICYFNKNILEYKFSKKKQKTINNCNNNLLFTEKVLNQLLNNIIIKLSENETQIVLTYLYEKCICFDNINVEITGNDDQSNNIEYLITKYNIPPFSIKSNNDKSSDSNIILQSQIIYKILMTIILQLNNVNIKLSFLSFTQLLCHVNICNIHLLLKCGLIKQLLLLLNAESQLKEKAIQLINTLLSFCNKEDLAMYFECLYNNLVLKNKIELSKELLSIMEVNLASSNQLIPSINFTLANINGTNTYHMYFLNNLKLLNTINIYISIKFSALESLNNFTLCHLIFTNKTASIIFQGLDLHCYINKKKKCTVNNIAQKIPLNKWIKVHIDKGNAFTASIKKNYLYITFPETNVFNQFNSESRKLTLDTLSICQSQTLLDFAGGYIDIKTIQNEQSADFKYKQLFPAQISYLAILNKRIKSLLIEDITSTNNKSLQLNLSSYSANEIIAEVIFNKIQLENCNDISEIKYKLSNFDYDLTQTDLIATIPCNNGFNNNKKLFLLKTENLIKYASMDHIYSIENSTKDELVDQLFSFNQTLDNTINDLFFADFIYAILDNLPLQVFLDVYQYLFRIVFVVNCSFQLLFFKKYMNHIKILLVKYAPSFSSDFVSLLIYNKSVEINESLQYEIISEVFFYPYLYTALPFNVKTKLNFEFEKFLNYYESNTDADYPKLKRILIRLWNIIIHFEIDVDIPQGEEGHLNVLVSLCKLIGTIITLTENNQSVSLVKYGLSYLNMINNCKKLLKKIHDSNKDGEIFITSVIQKQINALLPSLELYQTLNHNKQSMSSISILSHHFWIELTHFRQSILHDKQNKRLRTQFQLLWPNQLDEAIHFSWNLYKREGYGRMRRKMILKSNSICQENNEIKSNQQNSQINNKEHHTPFQKIFQKMSSYETHSDIPFVKLMIAIDDKYQNSYICLIIQKTEEIESLLILGENQMYIYTNIICDRNKRIYLSTKPSTRAFWARDDVKDEWDRLVCNNKNEVEKVIDKSCLIKHTRNDFQIKTIPYNQISEMHKRRYMLQNNSLEIFLLNGSSYFITVFPNNRDIIFNTITKNINEESVHSKIECYGKASKASVYLKHYPFIIIKSKYNKKQETKQSKALLDLKTLTNETSQKWSECFISNFNYIMIINTLGGRTYNDFSQYFIFPWILQDFYSNSFCLNNINYFRQLAFPIYAQTETNRNSLLKKVNSLKNKSSEEIYHSGTFISNISFISYYMIRIKPFTQVVLDIQGGKFDTADRLFSSTKMLCSLKTNAHEWIPEIVYFPEIMVNMNNYDFGKTQNLKEGKKIYVNDIDLPQWAECDPKYFNQILLKAVESPIVSRNLHNWFDLVFGKNMPYGKHNFEYFNRYLMPCYAYEDLKGKRQLNEFNLTLFQTKEFGSTPLQLTTKIHKQKTEGIYSFLSFFGTQTRLLQSSITSLNIICHIRNKKIGDMKGLSELSKYNASNGEGGLSSFTTYIDQSFSDSLEQEMKTSRPHMIVGSDHYLIGPRYTSVLSHSQKSIYIIDPCNSYALEFRLNEPEIINVSIPSSNGKYIIIGLANGSIIKYRKRINYDKSIVYPQLYPKEQKQKNQLKKNKNEIIEPKIIYLGEENNNAIDCFRTDEQLNKIENKCSKSQYTLYYLIEENISSWQLSSITKLSLCESQSLLIAIDQLSNVYLYDFNSFKLLYQFNFIKMTQSKEKIKLITIIYQNGDFILGTKTSLHLFTINGVYIGYMSIYDRDLRSISPITSIEAIFHFSTFVFTGHSDGSLLIWEIKAAALNIDKQESKQSPFLSSQFQHLYPSYHFRYNSSYNKEIDFNSHLNQRFDLAKKYNCNQNKLIYLKLSDDLMHLFIINNKKELFSLGCDQLLKENMIKGKKCLLHKSTLLNQCKNCKQLVCELCNETKLNSFNGFCDECSNSNISVEK